MNASTQQDVACLKVNSRFRRAIEQMLQFEMADLRSRRAILVGPLPDEALIALTYAAVTQKKAPRHAWEELWSAGSGKRWKSIRDLPKRLHKMAGQIKNLSDGVFGPEVWITSNAVEAQTVKRHFQQLPGLLEVYAVFVKRLIRNLPRGMAPYRKPEYAFHLSQFVKAITGQYRDREVAELLTAASLALGRTREWDATSIAQARSRRKRKTT